MALKKAVKARGKSVYLGAMRLMCDEKDLLIETWQTVSRQREFDTDYERGGPYCLERVAAAPRTCLVCWAA